MGYTGIGPATEPEPMQLPAGKEWKRTIIVNDDALSPVGQEQVDYRDAEIAKLRAELAVEQEETEQIHQIRLSLIQQVNELRAELDEARRDIAEWVRSDAELQTRIAAWKELADARSALLACYRLVQYPSERLLRRLDAANEAVRALTGAEGGASGE